MAAWAAVAPLALVAAGCRQPAGVVRPDLTAWNGDGFGMFSTVDSPGTRLVQVEVTRPLGR